MSDLQSFTKQDLVNLQKVVSIVKSTDCAYRDSKGGIRSAHRNKETVYRFELDGKYCLWVFNEHNKLVDTIKGSITGE
jgi:hypothetical protein